MRESSIERDVIVGKKGGIGWKEGHLGFGHEQANLFGNKSKRTWRWVGFEGEK